MTNFVFAIIAVVLLPLTFVDGAWPSLHYSLRTIVLGRNAATSAPARVEI